MRIGIDARLPCFRLGGISEYIVNLIDALAEIDADDHVTILHHKADRAQRVPRGAPNFVRADVETPCHHPMERLLLGAEIRPLDLDVLHSPDFIPPSSGARRLVITIHDLGFVDHPEHVAPDSHRHYAGQIAWAVRAAHAIATVSEHVRRRVIDSFDVPPEKVTAIPLAAARRFREPLDPDRVADVLGRHGLAPGFILFVGTLEPRKNLMTLLHAHDMLRDERLSDVPLVFAGPTGWLCDEVLAAVGNRPDTVRHLGVVAADDLPCLYAAAGVLALPSVHEGFGLPMLEAMHCGCPVVASTGGALPEVAAGAAVLADPADSHAWAAALSQVLNDSDLRGSLRIRGLARAAEFSWRRTAEATLALYRGR